MRFIYILLKFLCCGTYHLLGDAFFLNSSAPHAVPICIYYSLLQAPFSSVLQNCAYNLDTSVEKNPVTCLHSSVATREL